MEWANLDTNKCPVCGKSLIRAKGGEGKYRCHAHEGKPFFIRVEKLDELKKRFSTK